MSRALGPPCPAVDEYIARYPPGVRKRLESIRRAIRAVAPDATEVISYRMPGYSYPGYRLKGVFVWFAVQRGHIGLYLRPPTIEQHRRELATYGTTMSAVHLPNEGDVPAPLIQKLVRASLRVMREEAPKG